MLASNKKAIIRILLEMDKVPKVKSANWRIVIPHLSQYLNGTAQQLTALRYLILQRLRCRPQDNRSSIKSQFARGLRYYRIALQHHANGVPHLDILLCYDKSIQRYLTDYNYLLKQGHITTYRKLNAAIVDYGTKQDLQHLSNFPQSLKDVLEFQQFKTDPYRYLELQMLKDPLNFSLQQYVRKHDLNQYLPTWSSIKTRLKDSQVAAANLTLKSKPGFQLITRTLIQQRLTPDELKRYDSWPGYQTIVDYLNQIPLEGFKRQQKTKNLLLSGLPDCGKSALVWQRNPLSGRASLLQYCSVYPMGMSQWFPKYQSDVYHCIYWNQAKLTSYSYDTILKLLDGSPLDLPNKGAISRKVDNPLIVMTSNLTLEQMIQQKFGHSKSYVQMARANLKARVQQVRVPKGYNLFLLQKLLTPIN